MAVKDNYVYFLLLVLAQQLICSSGKELKKDERSFIFRGSGNDLADGVIRIPLKRLPQIRKELSIAKQAETKGVDFLVALWNLLNELLTPSPPPHPSIPGTNCVVNGVNICSEVGVSNNGNLFWFALLYFGTPPQPLPVQIDTGSSNLWVVGTNCTGPGCAGRLEFDYAASSTFTTQNMPISLEYGTGGVNGTVVTDTVSFGPSTSLTLAGETFTVATSLSPAFGEFSGILGLAWPNLATQNQPLFIQRLYTQNLIARNMFSFYSPRVDTEIIGTTGEMVIGGADSNYFTGDFTFVPIIQQSFWTFNLDSVGVRGDPTSFMPAGATALADTGTSVIQVSPAYYDPLLIALGGTVGNSTNLYVFDCNHLSDGTYKNLQIGIGGVVFELTAAMYTYPRGNLCISGINQFSYTPTQYIIGAIFLENYYTLFDYEGARFGIANLR